MKEGTGSAKKGTGCFSRAQPSNERSGEREKLPVPFFAALAMLSGCGLLPAAPDGGHVKVPGTYHDAKSSPGHRAHLALIGEKQLQCRDCHFVSDAGFNANAVKPCAECHARQQQHHHPFDAGTEPMSCFSCHEFRSAKNDKWGCQRCHVEKLEVHKEECRACHRPHGTPFTRSADCGQCHDVTISHGRADCMGCHPHHTKASVAVDRCAGCHEAKTRATFEKGHTGCSTCHASHKFTAAEARPCITCHQEKPVLAPTKHQACATCHDAHSPKAAPKTCETCHAKVHPEHPKTAGKTCTGCHPPHSTTVTKAATCTQCHAQQPHGSPPFTLSGGAAGAGVEAGHKSAAGCRDCHRDPHAGKPQRVGLCESCHKDQHALVKKNAGHKDCGACHANLPHGQPAPPKPCLECHPKQQPPQKGHAEAGCSACHQSHSAAVLKKCTDCHDKPLPALHAVKKHQKCESCHAPHEPQPGFGPAACKTCHPTLSAKSHPTPPQQCVGCHLFSGRK
jgi:hypothetical protein